MKNPTAHFDAHTGERWEWCSINYVYERKYHPFSLSVEENGREGRGSKSVGTGGGGFLGCSAREDSIDRQSLSDDST